MADNLDLGQLGHLSNLGLTAGELATYQGEFQEILKFVTLLHAEEYDDVSVTSQATDLENVYRHDTVAPSVHARTLIEAAAGHTEGYYRVPAVLRKKGNA